MKEENKKENLSQESSSKELTKEKAIENVDSVESASDLETKVNDNLTQRREDSSLSRRRSGLPLLVFVCGLTSLFFGMIGGFLGGDLSKNNSDKIEMDGGSFQEEATDSSSPLTKIFDGNSGQSDIKEESLIVGIVDEVSPAVVSILVTKDVPKMDSFYIDPFSGGFFMPFEENQDRTPDQSTEKKEVGGGSGFIVDSTGYIITNKHVVSDEDADYTVILNNGDKYTATVLARDSFMDIAVLKIDADNLVALRLGDSDALKIGQTTIAIGNSLGEFSNTVSKGIISGLRRNLVAGDSIGRGELLEEVIQTDAAINPGNSGGPVINLRGEAIGVNVAMAVGAENIGFAIPINEVKQIYQSVKDTGKIARPFLGVRYMLVDEEMAKANNLEFNYGALVAKGRSRSDLAIIPGSPADKAGLEENDIILEVDGIKVDSDNDLAKIIRKKGIEAKLKLKVWREGEIKEFEATLEEANS